MEAAEGRARLLADLSSALTSASNDLRRVLDTAVTSVAELVGEAAVLRLADDAGFLVETALYHPEPDKAAAMRALLDLPDQRAEDGLSGAVATTGRLYVDNAITLERLLATNPARLHPYLAVLDIRALVIAPLIVDGRYLGFLALTRQGTDAAYDRAEVDLTADIAARVALAVATARSISRLRTEQENYRQIVETSLEGIWKTGTDGVTTFVNPRMAEILGTTPDRMLGRRADCWVHDPSVGDGARRWAALLSGQTERHEIQLRRDDGSPVWVRVSASPIHDQDSTITGLLGMVSDITDHKRNEELSGRLEQLQRLDSLGQLAGGIAHDFNNLLSIIGGFADLWRAEVSPGAPERELADQIAGAVERGAGLTRQLLAFGRGQPGRAEVLDLREVVTELAPMLRRTIGEHIELVIAEADLTTRRLGVRIDRGQLEQVIVNLAANARDAMVGGGRLSVECERLLVARVELGLAAIEGADRTWYVRLAVSDSGQGMHADAVLHAFEPFYTTKGIGHGTGLGLASVYGIIRNAGGVAQLYSEIGHGTTIKIYLPACDDQAPAAEPPAPPRPARIRQPGHDIRVLVVEDSTELAAVVERLLTRAGYQVTVRHDPTEALSLLESGHPVDLVITDVVMPRLTGPELAQAIHRRWPGLPFLYTSGYTAGALGERVQLEPDAVLVEKPFNHTTLLRAVEALLDASGPSAG